MPRSISGPSRNDGVTITCPVCRSCFVPVGRQRVCSARAAFVRTGRRHPGVGGKRWAAVRLNRGGNPQANDCTALPSLSGEAIVIGEGLPAVAAVLERCDEPHVGGPVDLLGGRRGAVYAAESAN
jgi:hypothetical protein